MHAPLLARLYPEVTVETDLLDIEDGPVLTSAGSAAAIDLCLHWIRREHGAEIANSVARQMVAPPHRSGGQAQYIEMTIAEPAHPDDLAETLEWAQQGTWTSRSRPGFSPPARRCPRAPSPAASASR